MTLAEHLRELRSRLAKALIGLALAAIVGYIVFPTVFEVLKAPYCDIPADLRPDMGEGCTLTAFGPLDQFMVRLKVAAATGALLSSPLWLYQLWAFITPGLRRNERRWALSFVGASLVLFLVGATLAYVFLQTGLELLLGIAPGTTTVLEVTRYLRYVLAMLLVFGVSFELPLLVVMLNLSGVVSHTALAKWRRLVLFGVFVFAGIATPSQDPFTMLALAVPMAALFELSVQIARLHDRRQARREAVSPLTGLADDEVSPLASDDLSSTADH